MPAFLRIISRTPVVTASAGSAIAHFADQETEAEGGALAKVSQVKELGFAPRSVCFRGASHRDVPLCSLGLQSQVRLGSCDEGCRRGTKKSWFAHP